MSPRPERPAAFAAAASAQTRWLLWSVIAAVLCCVAGAASGWPSASSQVRLDPAESEVTALSIHGSERALYASAAAVPFGTITRIRLPRMQREAVLQLPAGRIRPLASFIDTTGASAVMYVAEGSAPHGAALLRIALGDDSVRAAGTPASAMRLDGVLPLTSQPDEAAIGLAVALVAHDPLSGTVIVALSSLARDGSGQAAAAAGGNGSYSNSTGVINRVVRLCLTGTSVDRHCAGPAVLELGATTAGGWPTAMVASFTNGVAFIGLAGAPRTRILRVRVGGAAPGAGDGGGGSLAVLGQVDLPSAAPSPVSVLLLDSSGINVAAVAFSANSEIWRLRARDLAPQGNATLAGPDDSLVASRFLLSGFYDADRDRVLLLGSLGGGELLSFALGGLVGDSGADASSAAAAARALAVEREDVAYSSSTQSTALFAQQPLDGCVYMTGGTTVFQMRQVRRCARVAARLCHAYRACSCCPTETPHCPPHPAPPAPPGPPAPPLCRWTTWCCGRAAATRAGAGWSPRPCSWTS